MDARGPMEARVLGVERGLDVMDRDLHNLKRQLIGLTQGIWDAWNDVGRLSAPPVATPPANPFPAICSSFPTTMPVIDSLYGGSILTFDGVSKWLGCKVVAVPAGGACGAIASSAVFYSLQGDNTTSTWVLTVSYDATGVNHCPVNGATCGTATNRSDTMSQTISCCAPYQFSYPHGNIASPIWGNHDITLTITPFVGNLTSASTIPFTFTSAFLSGSGTLAWDAGTSTWRTCVASISFSGNLSCSNATIAITFVLDLFGNLTMKWIKINATNCPAASNCASTPGAGQSNYTGTCFYHTDSCPSSVTYQLSGVGGSSPEARLGSPTVTLTL
jgi:hypothetical protein